MLTTLPCGRGAGPGRSQSLSEQGRGEGEDMGGVKGGLSAEGERRTGKGGRLEILRE